MLEIEGLADAFYQHLIGYHKGGRDLQLHLIGVSA